MAATRRDEPARRGRRHDLLFDIDGQPVVVEVKSVVTSPDAPNLIDLIRRHGGNGLVAADRIAAAAKQQFIEAGVGFLDRRGRLRLVVPGSIFVDTVVSPPPSRSASLRSLASGPLTSEVTKEVAVVLLADGHESLGVRQLAARIDRAPSSVFNSLKRLRDAGLVTSQNRPVNPDLFWELESAWSCEVHSLAGVPSRDELVLVSALRLGLGHRERGMRVLDPEGWALTDVSAAGAWGVPLKAPSSYRPHFYVPSWAVLHHAIAALGSATGPETAQCTVRVAPIRLVCRRRLIRPRCPWPVVDHIVMALDLVQHHLAGRKALDRWHPQGLARVW